MLKGVVDFKHLKIRKIYTLSTGSLYMLIVCSIKNKGEKTTIFGASVLKNNVYLLIL